MTDNTYFKIQSFMIHELNLKGNELIVFAYIYSFTTKTDKKCYYGTQDSIADNLCITRQTVNRCINSLLKKGYIKKIKTENNSVSTDSYVSNIVTGSVTKCDNDVSQNVTDGCNKMLHNNYIDNYNYNNNNKYTSSAVKYSREKFRERYDFSEYSKEDLTELYSTNNEAGLTVAEYDMLYKVVYEKPLERYLLKITNYDSNDNFRTIIQWAIEDGNYKGLPFEAPRKN